MAFNTNPGKQLFTATSGQTVFDFNFKIYAETDLKVYLTPTGSDPNDADDILTYGTEYTVVIDGNDGGTVTLLTGATLNDTIVIARDLPQTRDTSYVTNGDFKAATLNADQDYQTYLILDGYVALQNTVQLPQSAVGVDPVLPNVRSDSYLKWNSAGDALENDETIPDAVITSATNATNAANSAAAAATSYDNFDDRYLGEKTSDPLTDNDGDPLLTGALYFNTVANAMKVYNGAAWQLAYASINTSMISKSYYDRSESFDATQNNLTIPDIYVIVNASLISITSETININTAGYWDDATYATASNRAGKDFYVYALEAGGYILSNNSTYPTGYNATNSRKIAGFHCLCSNVGTISGHSLTGYLTGDILPRSIWDLKDKPRSAPEGMSKNYDGVWVDIYLPSWDGTKLVSVYGGTVADGANGWHNYKFEQRFGMIGKKLIRQTEFVVASLGSNQGTTITGSADPGTTGAHTDTAGRRMISDIGCEDMCGAYWQWSRDPGGSVASGAAWANAYDGNDSGVAGQHYQAPYRALLGGDWVGAAICGSRASLWDNSPLSLAAAISGRGVAEPVDSQN